MAAQFDDIIDLTNVEPGEFSPHELNVMIEIATVVSSASDIRDVYSSFSALVADVLEWDGIIVNTPTDDGKTFHIRVREGQSVPSREPGTRFEIEGSLYGETLRTRKTQYYTADEGQTTELALKVPGLRNSLLVGFRSFMATPLFSHGEVVGAIHIQSIKPFAFTPHDQLLLERIALFIGPTVGRFRTYEELKQDDLRNESLLRVGRLLLGARDIGDVFEQFIEEVKTVVEIDRISIAVIQPDQKSLVNRFVSGVDVEGYGVDSVIPLNEMGPNGLDPSSHGYIIDSAKMLNADPAVSPGLLANYKAGLRSAMFAGFHSEGRLIGSINIKSLNENAYGVPELEYFEQIGDHVAASIARTLAYESEIETGRIEEDRIRAQQEATRVVDVIRAKERLLTSASHELRTPLTGIVAFVDLLARNRDGNLDDKQMRYLSIVRRNAEELSTKVNSLIDHAARDTGQLNLTLEEFDLLEMLREAVTDAAPKLAENGHVPEIEAIEETIIIGDRRQLLVALGHLIENAANYAPHDTAIRIVGKWDSRNVELSVIDQGDGVSSEHVRGIFEPFERGANTGAAVKPGAGLGLTYVRAVAVAHGGGAEYESTEDGGAKFTIRFPVRQN